MKKERIGIIGLGYVGLPLAVEFAKQYSVIGYDINENRIRELRNGADSTDEVDEASLRKVHSSLKYTVDDNELKGCAFIIVTVPTPVNFDNRPDLNPLISASRLIGKVLTPGMTIIYESTVYPGVTEEVCVPILEEESSLTLNIDFFVGYSPERINPGDTSRGVADILKVTSGSNELAARNIDTLYKSIITAGTYMATTIRVAEASKVIENVQRDVNIALVNELHQIFTRLGINTTDVINAAATKWNFMKLNPGLVGGHCIGVDPYYLLHKAQTTGYIPDLMRSAREINNAMPDFVVNEFIAALLKKKINPVNLKVLLLGCTFKEDCPDTRNSKNIDLCGILTKMGFKLVIYDPIVDKEEFFIHYKMNVLSELPSEYDVAVLAVGHKVIIDSILEIKERAREKFVFDYRNMV